MKGTFEFSQDAMKEMAEEYLNNRLTSGDKVKVNFVRVQNDGVSKKLSVDFEDADEEEI